MCVWSGWIKTTRRVRIFPFKTLTSEDRKVPKKWTKTKCILPALYLKPIKSSESTTERQNNATYKSMCISHAWFEIWKRSKPICASPLNTVSCNHDVEDWSYSNEYRATICSLFNKYLKSFLMKFISRTLSCIGLGMCCACCSWICKHTNQTALNRKW